MSPSRQGLTKGKQVLPAKVSDQRLDDDFFRGLDPSVPKFCQCYRIPLASQDRIHDAKAGKPRDVANNVVDLQIHLIQRLLHPQYMSRRRLNETVPMTHQRPKYADLIRRPEGRPQQSDRMQVT